jgi:hypothetical protein
MFSVRANPRIRPICFRKIVATLVAGASGWINSAPTDLKEVFRKESPGWVTAGAFTCGFQDFAIPANSREAGRLEIDS